MDAPLPIAFADVQDAAARLAGVAHRTPVLTSRTLDARVGGRVLLKAESLQRMGAFKFRGAYNRISRLSSDERARGIVAASSGNHAQAVALAASLCASDAVILMPRDAPAGKRAATEGYGARVVEYDRYHDDRERLAAQIAEREGRVIVPAYDDPLVMAGAGTVALELVQDAGPLDVLVAPVGGGGLMSGCAVAARALTPCGSSASSRAGATTRAARWRPAGGSPSPSRRRSPTACSCRRRARARSPSCNGSSTRS